MTRRRKTSFVCDSGNLHVKPCGDTDTEECACGCGPYYYCFDALDELAYRTTKETEERRERNYVRRRRGDNFVIF